MAPRGKKKPAASKKRRPSGSPDELAAVLDELAAAGVHGRVLLDYDMRGETVPISHVEPGMLFFAVEGEEGPEELGPVVVPRAVSALAAAGMQITSPHFVKTDKGWALVELGEISA